MNANVTNSIEHSAKTALSALVLFVLIMNLPSGVARGAIDERTASVGMAARIEQLVLPGSELEVKPLENRQAPLVLRIAAIYLHGTAFRYDFVYYGLDPGEYDLRSQLRRKDGSSTDDLPPIPVKIVSVLPPGQVKPHGLTGRRLPRVGGYRLMLYGAGVLWVAGFVAILVVGRRRRLAAANANQKPQTLADRLQPLVEQAVAGQLPTARLAELERLLLAYWRKRLKLEKARPADAIQQLRSHPEASGLLRQLERWLHAPATAEPVAIDVASLLAPYRNLPPEALETPSSDERLPTQE